MRGVPRPTTGRVVLVVAEVDREFLTQCPLEDRPGDLGQQPVRAEELHPLGLGAGQQLVGELVIDHHRRRGSLSGRLGVVSVSDITCSLPGPRCGPESSHVTYTDGLTHPDTPLVQQSSSVLSQKFVDYG